MVLEEMDDGLSCLQKHLLLILVLLFSKRSEEPEVMVELAVMDKTTIHTLHQAEVAADSDYEVMVEWLLLYIKHVMQLRHMMYLVEQMVQMVHLD